MNQLSIAALIISPLCAILVAAMMLYVQKIWLERVTMVGEVPKRHEQIRIVDIEL
jgi:hypothetical protein